MDIKKEIYDLAFQIAIKAHQGQTRHDKETPYIVHPMDVAIYFDDYLDKAIAVLHDAVEDGKDNGVDLEYIRLEIHKLSDKLSTSVSFDQKRFILLSGRLLCAIDDLTKPVGKTYLDYIREIEQDNIKFKLADIYANSTDSPNEYQREKYKKALKILINRI